MPLHIHPPPGEVIERIREAIEGAIPGADVEVSGSGGHFEIRVVSASFEGQGTLARHRRVYAAVTPLMSGEGAPVHAIDRLETVVPDAS